MLKTILSWYLFHFVNHTTKRYLQKEPELKGFEADMENRKEFMKRGCRKHGLDERRNDSLHQPYAWEYLIARHDDINLVWCNIFKSASSRLLYFLISII